jgi:hypothetical protein
MTRGLHEGWGAFMDANLRIPGESAAWAFSGSLKAQRVLEMDQMLLLTR